MLLQRKPFVCWELRQTCSPTVIHKNLGQSHPKLCVLAVPEPLCYRSGDFSAKRWINSSKPTLSENHTSIPLSLTAESSLSGLHLWARRSLRYFLQTTALLLTLTQPSHKAWGPAQGGKAHLRVLGFFKMCQTRTARNSSLEVSYFCQSLLNHSQILLHPPPQSTFSHHYLAADESHHTKYK